MEMADARGVQHLRPGTRRNLQNQFRVFFSFCIFYRLNALALTPGLLCAYIEFLLHSFPCPGTIRNYVSAVSTLYAWLGLDMDIFRSCQVLQMWRAVKLTVRYSPKVKHSLTVSELQSLLKACVVLGSNSLLFCAFLTTLYFTMVRVSSMIPYSHGGFDLTRHVTMSDLFRIKSGLSLKIKWAKNVQSHGQGFSVPLQPHVEPDVCPILGLARYLHSGVETNQHAPLFQIKGKGGIFTLFTIREVRCWLRVVQQQTILAGINLGFHSFRRGACNAAFLRGAPLSDLKFFGNWKSDAVLQYLEETPAKLRVSNLLSLNL